MRTTLDLDDELLQKAMSYSSARTKKALVHEALRDFVERKANERRRREYREGLAAIEGRLAHIEVGESALEILRRDRESR